MALAFTPTTCFSSNMEGIAPLTGCVTDCNIEDVPDITLDPDQRDIQFPPITPNQNVTIATLGGCRPSPRADGDPINTLGTSDVSAYTAATDTWERATLTASTLTTTSVTLLVRMAFEPSDGVSNGHLWAFYRTYDYDSCGALIRISAETRVEYSQTGPCGTSS